MRVLILGGGGREHAFAWRLRRESAVSEVVCAPGNPGISQIARCLPLDPSKPGDALALARAERIDLTISGPEAPLAAGVQDLFSAAGLLLTGPTRLAARLESSKAFAKAFMDRHGIPTARHRVCRDREEAHSAVRDAPFGYPIVLKADGLAAGKGVVIAQDRGEAERAVDDMMVRRAFGPAGDQLVIEEFLDGIEASFFVLSDGRVALPLGSAQDHKRVFDDDRGPNTGGMGAFSPSPLIDPGAVERVMREIVSPVVAGMRDEGAEYRGFLYVGLMLTAAGPKVVEFNVRFGDPEAQVVLPRLESELAPLLASAARGDLSASVPESRQGPPHVGIVLAAAGYPGEYGSGAEIHGLDRAQQLEGVLVFHAGTGLRNGRIVTAGGRVLTVVGSGPDFPTAISRAYSAADEITFQGKHMRRDIGRKALMGFRL